MTMYCGNCGQPLPDGVQPCPRCGAYAAGTPANGQAQAEAGKSFETLTLVAFIFSLLAAFGVSLYALLMALAIGAAAMAPIYAATSAAAIAGWVSVCALGCLVLLLVALEAWICMRCWKIHKGQAPNTTGFAIAALLLSNIVSGILLLVADKQR